MSLDGRGRNVENLERYTDNYGLNDEICHGQCLPYLCQYLTEPKQKEIPPKDKKDTNSKGWGGIYKR